jgi:O-antigen/teichoic acid export membrane protein
MPSTNELELDHGTFRPALMLMSGKVLAFAATFFVPIVLARVFSPAQFGTYKQFFLVLYMLYGIGQVGMAESLFYFLPASQEGAGRYVTNSILVLASTGVVVLAGFTLLSKRVAHSMNNPELGRYLPICGLYLLLMLTACVLEIVWISRKKYKSATVCYASSDLLRAALLIGPALWFRSLQAVFVGGLLFCIARAVAALAVVRKEFPGEVRPDAGLLRKQLVYAVPFALAVIVDVVQANYHQLAVSSYFDAATYAIYAVGCLQIPLVDFMSTPASNVMMVRMGEEIRDGRAQSVMPIWHDCTRKLALVFFPLVALLTVTASALITFLFTARYAASASIFMVWSLSILLAPLQTDSVMRVFAQTRFLLCINLIRLVVLVSVMYWFLHHFGLMGAVAVTVLGNCFAKGMALVRISALTKTSLSELLPWDSLGRVLLIAMISAAPAALLSTYVAGPPIVTLLASGSVFLLTYTSLIFIFGALTNSEKHAIWTRLERWKRCVE